MPKLSEDAIEANKTRIEDAAKELFIRQGFHATSMRDIASRAQTSLGNLYNYYRTKEAILESIISKYQTVIDERLQRLFSGVEEPFEPKTLKRFGRAIREMVGEHHDFWLLMYIDVLEFENRHFRRMFEGLTARLRKQFARQFAELKRQGLLADGIDPAVGFTAVYMQFFNPGRKTFRRQQPFRHQRRRGRQQSLGNLLSRHSALSWRRETASRTEDETQARTRGNKEQSQEVISL